MIEKQSTTRPEARRWLRDVLVATACFALGGPIGLAWAGAFGSFPEEPYIATAIITCINFILGGVSSAIVRTIAGPVHRRHLWIGTWLVFGAIAPYVMILLFVSILWVSESR